MLCYNFGDWHIQAQQVESVLLPAEQNVQCQLNCNRMYVSLQGSRIFA